MNENNKIKIGIDLDKTLFNCNSFIYKILSNINYHKEKNHSYYEVPSQGIYKCSFMNKIFKYLNPSKYYAFPKAIETINSLHDQGYSIYFVSSRPNMKAVVYLTYEWLKNHNVKYDKLVLGCKNKPVYAKNEGINYFIDDLKFTCEKMSDIGIYSFLFNGFIKDNSDKKLKPFLKSKRTFNWNDIKNFFESKALIYTSLKYKDEENNNKDEELESPFLVEAESHSLK